MYLEVPDDFDLATDFQAYTDSSPRAKEWDELMRNFQSQVPEAKERRVVGRYGRSLRHRLVLTP